MTNAPGLGAVLALSFVAAMSGARAQMARHGGVAEPIVVGGQLLGNYAVVGIGIEGFAGLWSTRHYYGVGLTLAVGGF